MKKKKIIVCRVFRPKRNPEKKTPCLKKVFSAISEDVESFDPTNPQNIENNINTSGYQLINAKRLTDAIDVFKMNVKLFPNSWNPFDSLGEALALSKDKEGAMENYEKSIKLNLKNTNGIEALKKLKGQ